MTYSIVRKRAYSAMSRGAYISPRARMAMRGGMYVYRNRAKFKRAARVIGRAYKRSKRTKAFSAKNVGFNIGEGTGKRYISQNNGPVLQQTRQLIVENLSDIPKGDAINERERDIVNVRGFKVCMELNNVTSKPMYVNMAMICPKNSSAPSVINFFRDSGLKRAKNFDDNLTSLELHCLPINTDLYTVLRHKRMILAPGDTPTDTATLTGRSYTNVDWYVPLKRQMRYASTSALNSADRVYLVYWCDLYATGINIPGTLNALQAAERHITYFREPKH